MHRDDWNETVEFTTDTSTEVSRREFLELAGAGLFIFFAIDPMAALQEPSRLPSRPSYPTDFNAYLRIGGDGRVTCFVGKVELGQGSKTALAQLAAEELDVSLDTVDMVMGDTDLCPWDMGTFGSLTIRQFGPVLRGAAAEARAVLLQMSADYLQLPSVEGLQVKDGVVSWAKDERKRVSYAKLVEGKRIERHLEKVPVKAVSAFTVIGKAPRRKDALEKVTGKARYAADMTLPGTLHARVLRPPAHGATLKDVDTTAAEKIPGVRVIRDNDLIAALHEQPDIADRALGLIRARFEPPKPGEDDRTIFDHLLKAAPPLQMVDEKGSLADGEKLATRVVEETYLQQLRGTCGDGNALSSRRNRGRQIDCLGQHADSLSRSPTSGAGSGLRTGKRAGYHPVCGWRIRRQERVAPSGGSSTPGQDHGQAGAGGVGPRGGILLRYVPTRRRREDSLRTGRCRETSVVGLPRVLRRRARGPAVL